MAVWIEINGGLGNQLFEYAFAKALEINYELDVQLNTTRHYYPGSYRNLELNKFHISLPLSSYKHKISLFDRLHILTTINSKKRRALRDKVKQYPQTKAISDFNPALDMKSIKDNDYLIGLFQKVQYFDNIYEILQKDFTLKQDLSEKNQAMLERIQASMSVSLHVRRGDFIQENSSIVLLEEDYFKNALVKMEQLIGKNFVLYIFTEDLEWAKANIKAPQEMVFVDINDGFSVVFDLELMKNCKHNILSNSTLAWWGGYLNKNKEKIVIAPKEYFYEQAIFNADILCPEWVKL